MIEQLRGILLLTGLYLLGALMVPWLGIGIPGAVAGLSLCLVAMIAAPSLQAVIRPGALVMLGLVPLFLVPLLVRMSLRLDFTLGMTWLYVLVAALSCTVSVVVTGLAAKFLLPAREEE